MKTIFTVQHTQSEHHTNGMVGSWTDWNLTELGKQADQCHVLCAITDMDLNMNGGQVICLTQK